MRETGKRDDIMSESPSRRMTFTPSEHVLLHAAQFAAPGTFTDATTPIGADVKVRATELAQSMLAAAILANEMARAIVLEPGTKKKLFGLRKVEALLVRAGAATPTFPEGTLEARVLPALRKAGPDADVARLTHELLGEESTAPWEIPQQIAMAALAERKLLDAEETRTLKIFKGRRYVLPDATREQARASPPDAARRLLDAGKARGPVWALLADGIREGVKSRQESTSDGPD